MAPFPLSADAEAIKWFERDAEGNPSVHLYFYWSRKCPHCLTALPHVQRMGEVYPWLSVHAYQLVGQDANVKRFQWMANAMGREARSVPAFLFCGTMMTGFDEENTLNQLTAGLSECYRHLNQYPDLQDYPESALPGAGVALELPFVGKVVSGADSLPFITLALAGVDAFNPCAFFVLMFLLSMMLHTGSRRRMLLVGGVFVLFSGLLYFLFMSAWLNLFRMIGQLEAITIAAAVLAIVIGSINMKDFFWFKKGVSMTIPDSAKPALYRRTRHLLRAESLYTLIPAAMALSFFANLYEFLCTAGFPMVYTRILTLSDLQTPQFYLYLALYNLIYITPLMIIVLLFVASLGSRKLQQREGRGLKLISGAMMLALGMVLLIEPALLHNVVSTLGIMVLAVVLALLLIVFDKYRERSAGIRS